MSFLELLIISTKNTGYVETIKSLPYLWLMSKKMDAVNKAIRRLHEP
jgi:hypothetical protein